MDSPGLKTIFTEALARPGGPDRAAYLEGACRGDAELRAQAEALLADYEHIGQFLGTATGSISPSARTAGDEPGAPRTGTISPTEVRGAHASPSAGPVAEGPGTVIGPYKLREKIGEGGMGVVYLAEQEKPVRRRVALKVIKPGMDTGQVVARFEAERQALAMMDHPSIARVLDAGATESGRPYFVMELVKGVPITEYCDTVQLTPRERLELFIPVCAAVQHAHQKGIIHRDIKPSNVLVAMQDGRPVPKVIDFGIAKATEQRLTERSLFTQHGAIVGTLEYMSPEQAEMSAMGVDTRTDVYALGVMLYELLTGSTPLEHERLRRSAYAEIVKRIREEEPPKPSTRLSESREALPSIAASRKTEPARLSKLVRGDLDWIVMKALEKDRTRRYETANGFARDLRRHLDGDPVEACPPSSSYRLRKFARKHRAALATAGAFLLLLVAATAVSVGLAVWADRERGRAVRAEALARVQQGRAREREQMAIDAVRRFGDVVRGTPELKDNPALAPLRAALLKEPLAFFKRLRDRLQADRETAPDSLSRLAAASSDLGKLADEIGDKQDALRAYGESLATLERLAQGGTSDIQLWRHLAGSHNNIGELLRATGRPAEAMASFGRGLAIRERLAREDPSVAEFQRDLAGSHNGVGIHHAGAGRPAEAMASYGRAAAIQERLAHENPEVQQLREDLADSHNNISIVQGATGRPAEALASNERALVILERLVREEPSATRFRSRLASVHDNIGIVLGQVGRPAEAMASLEHALAILERLARENPSVPQFWLVLAACHSFIGELHRQAGRPADAAASDERALAIRERLAREHPESPDFASDLGGALNNMAMADLHERRFDAAKVKLAQAIQWQRKALATDPRNPTYRQFLGNHLTNLVAAAEGLGDEAGDARRQLAELIASDPAKAALDARLTAVLGGEPPGDDSERIGLALRAYQKALHAASARLFAEALANDPKLGDDRRAQNRYNAACAAALAASGRGVDDPPPDDAARARLAGQAGEWLRAERSAWAKLLDAGPAETRANVARALQHWKADADLAGIRDEKELAKLPAEVRAEFQRLWSDVDELLTRAVGHR